jgi:hypothetical protein
VCHLLDLFWVFILTSAFGTNNVSEIPSSLPGTVKAWLNADARAFGSHRRAYNNFKAKLLLNSHGFLLLNFGTISFNRYFKEKFMTRIVLVAVPNNPRCIDNTRDRLPLPPLIPRN